MKFSYRRYKSRYPNTSVDIPNTCLHTKIQSFSSILNTGVHDLSTICAVDLLKQNEIASLTIVVLCRVQSFYLPACEQRAPIALLPTHPSPLRGVGRHLRGAVFGEVVEPGVQPRVLVRRQLQQLPEPGGKFTRTLPRLLGGTPPNDRPLDNT